MPTCGMVREPARSGATQSETGRSASGMARVDWLILSLYIVFVVGIGFALKSSMKTSTDLFLGHFDVCQRQACSDVAHPGRPLSAVRGQQLPNSRFRDLDFCGDCARVHLPWRPFERHLQRSGAVFSYRGGIPAAYVDWVEKRGRLG